MHRLICSFVVRIRQKQVFSWRGSFRVITIVLKADKSWRIMHFCNFSGDHWWPLAALVKNLKANFLQMTVKTYHWLPKREIQIHTSTLPHRLVVKPELLDGKHACNCKKNKLNEPQHDKTSKMTCVPGEDSDQTGQPCLINLRCPHEETGSIATHWVHSEDSDQTGWMPRLIWVFAGRTCHLLVLSYAGPM